VPEVGLFADGEPGEAARLGTGADEGPAAIASEAVKGDYGGLEGFGCHGLDGIAAEFAEGADNAVHADEDSR